MAMACMDDVQWGGTLQRDTSLASMNHPGIFAGQQKKEKSLKGRVRRVETKCASPTYPTTDYANNFYVGTSTGTAYTAGSGITVTTANNSLSNSYSLNDALSMK